MIASLVHDKVSFRRLAAALGMPVQTLHGRYARHTGPHAVRPPRADDPALVDWIVELKAIRPSWGIRRVRAFIRHHTGLALGRKRTARILRERTLLCSRFPKRVHRERRPRLTATRMNQLWATDMTSFTLAGGTRMFLVVVLDIFTRRIVGWNLSRRCRAREWLTALENALRREFPEGVRDAGLTLRMDNGCQPTSRLYLGALDTLAITGEWVGFNCPEQNAHVESLIGTLKRDWLWLEDCATDDEAMNLCRRAVTEYNHDHPHTGLGMLSPITFTQLLTQGKVTVTDNHTIKILTHAA